jgi:AcrR family transcriptional regulator
MTEPRERLIAAMREAIIEKGYRETTVADVVRIAHTSRRTFYEHFEDREHCFLALFEQTTGHTMERIAAAVHPDAPWEEQVDAALDAYIDAVCEQPRLQQSFVRELPGLAREGAEHQRQVIERFAQLLTALVESGRQEQPSLMAHPLPLDVSVIIVGGLRELLIIAVQQGRDPRELRETVGQVVKAIMRSVVL